MTSVDLPPPSPWVTRFASLVRPKGSILDVACGSGRHSQLFLNLGHPVTAVDRDTGRLGTLSEKLETIQSDLEDGSPPVFAGRRFAGIIVTNYLYRPLLPQLADCLEENGVLIYETFALGNEKFGKPSNPNFLLKPGELWRAIAPALRVLAYEDMIDPEPRLGARQRICAIREPA